MLDITGNACKIALNPPPIDWQRAILPLVVIPSLHREGFLEGEAKMSSCFLWRCYAELACVFLLEDAANDLPVAFSSRIDGFLLPWE